MLFLLAKISRNVRCTTYPCCFMGKVCSPHPPPWLWLLWRGFCFVLFKSLISCRLHVICRDSCLFVVLCIYLACYFLGFLDLWLGVTLIWGNSVTITANIALVAFSCLILVFLWCICYMFYNGPTVLRNSGIWIFFSFSLCSFGNFTEIS